MVWQFIAPYISRHMWTNQSIVRKSKDCLYTTWIEHSSEISLKAIQGVAGANGVMAGSSRARPRHRWWKGPI